MGKVKILLDIDGVMVKSNSWVSPKILEDDFLEFNSPSISTLQYIITVLNVDKIVLTNTHRGRFNVKQWEEIFKRRELDIGIEKLEKCEDKYKIPVILQWIRDNKNKKYIIIDNGSTLSEYIEFKAMKGKLIIPTPSIGLGFLDILQLDKNIFKSKNSRGNAKVFRYTSEAVNLTSDK